MTWQVETKVYLTIFNHQLICPSKNRFIVKLYASSENSLFSPINIVDHGTDNRLSIAEYNS